MGNFVRHEVCDKCGSSDGKAIYEENGVLSHYCWVCKDCSPSEEYRKELHNARSNKPKKVIERVEKLKDKVTQEQTDELKSRTSLKGKGYRGIRDETLKFFQVRTEYDADGEVEAVYYPATEDNELVGWKCRTHPKQFGVGNLGRTGNSCEMFGQFFHKTGGKTCLIVGGEHDAMAAHQMLKDYYLTKQWDFEPVVVSPLVGETGCAKQIAANYTWFDKFDKIIIGFDNDKAGKAAVDDVVAVLPKGKAFVATWSLKDPNEMLEKDKARQFISNFYDAKKYVPTGVIGSGDISSAMREEFNVPKIPLPKFMHKLQALMAGGIPLGRIINIGAASGIGKSTIIDEIVYDMIFNSPHKVGIVTLESTVGQYGNKLLSRHINKKIELESNDTALKILNSEEVLAKEKELFWLPDNEHRFYLVDDRDGGADNVKAAIEGLVISCGCKVIVLDPVNDVIGTLSNEEQESFYGWQKGMVKSHGCTFYNVMHTRKTSQGQQSGSTGADLKEEDLMGSSSAYKSAACNLMFSRNKEAEDPIERNTTIMKMSKCRWTGQTGLVGKYYYDNQSHTMYDLDDWLNNS